jgi:hypothetical protein
MQLQYHFSFLYLMYSIRPKRLPAVMLRNHDKERAVATSGLILMRLKKKTKAPSLTPMPDIEIGSIVNTTIGGIKIRHARKGRCSPIPSARMYTATIPESWTKIDISKDFTIISF